MVSFDDAPARRLVTSYCFPPYADTAAIVAAKRVREHGEPVDVIYNAMDAIRSQDPGTSFIAGPWVRRSHVVQSRATFSGWRSIQDFHAHGTATVLRWEREQGPYSSLYSRAQFVASHFLASDLKLMRPSIHWDAEFSDPLSHDVLGAVRDSPAQDGSLLARLREGIEGAGFAPPEGLNAFEWCEAIVYATADSIMFTNEGQRDFMLERCHDQRLAERAYSVAVVSPHPTLPREYYALGDVDYALDDGCVHIGYFGNFYANRGITHVLDAMELVPRPIRDQLRLHVFTSDPDELARDVQTRGLGGSIRTNAFVPFFDFLALCDRMDCLLVNDAVSPSGLTSPFLPSKWSDYKGSASRVWGVVEEGSPLSRQNLDYRSPVEHTTATAQVLARLAVGD